MKMKKAIIPALAIAAIATTSVIASACPGGPLNDVKPGPAAHELVKPEGPKKDDTKPAPGKKDDDQTTDDSEGGISASTLFSIDADRFEAAWEDLLETALLISGNQSKTISVDALRSFVADSPISAFQSLASLLTDDTTAAVSVDGYQIVVSAEIPSLKTAFSALDKACSMTFTLDCSDMAETKSIGCSLVFIVDGQSFSAKELVALAEQAFAAAGEDVPENVAEMEKILADCEKSAAFDSKKMNELLKKMNKEYENSDTMPDSVKELTDIANYVWAFVNECVLSDSVSLDTKSFKKLCDDMSDLTVTVENGKAVITAAMKDDEQKTVLSYFKDNTDALQTLANEAVAAGAGDITGLSAYEEGMTLSKTAKYLEVTLPLDVLAGEEDAASLRIYRTYEFKAAKDDKKPVDPAAKDDKKPVGPAAKDDKKPAGPAAKDDKKPVGPAGKNEHKSLSSSDYSDYEAYEDAEEYTEE